MALLRNGHSPRGTRLARPYYPARG
jgi:hypothetical protein